MFLNTSHPLSHQDSRFIGKALIKNLRETPPLHEQKIIAMARTKRTMDDLVDSNVLHTSREQLCTGRHWQLFFPFGIRFTIRLYGAMVASQASKQLNCSKSLQP